MHLFLVFLSLGVESWHFFHFPKPPTDCFVLQNVALGLCLTCAACSDFTMACSYSYCCCFFKPSLDGVVWQRPFHSWCLPSQSGSFCVFPFSPRPKCCIDQRGCGLRDVFDSASCSNWVQMSSIGLKLTRSCCSPAEEEKLQFGKKSAISGWVSIFLVIIYSKKCLKQVQLLQNIDDAFPFMRPVTQPPSRSAPYREEVSPKNK